MGKWKALVEGRTHARGLARSGAPCAPGAPGGKLSLPVRPYSYSYTSPLRCWDECVYEYVYGTGLGPDWPVLRGSGICGKDRVVGLRLAIAAALLLLGTSAGAAVLDDFDTLAGWTAIGTDGVRVELARDAEGDDAALRIDYDFTRGGHVLVRKAVALTLPADYVFTFRARADGPPLSIEFKLIDADESVWWHRDVDLALPATWIVRRIRKRQITFAWGPAGGGAPGGIAAIEFAIKGAAGDRGSLWIDDLTLTARLPAPRTPPVPRATASTAADGEGPQHVLDDDPATRWRSGALGDEQWLSVDFGLSREYGGLVIDWDEQDFATAYDVLTSDDGEHWTTRYHVTHGNGARDALFLPDSESRHLRLLLHASSREAGYAVRALRLVPIEAAASANAFFTTRAADAPRGTFPRYFSGEQTYWTVVGADGDGEEAALNEDGALEVARGAFSIEPFLRVDGHLLSWHDAERRPSLADGWLPIPTVTWTLPDLRLAITAFVDGAPGQAVLYARYRVENPGAATRGVRLLLAVRPFQVLPPWQTLNMIGGVAPLDSIAIEERGLRAGGHTIVSLTPPTQAGAATFDEGEIVDLLQRELLPRRQAVSDPLGLASAVLAWVLDVPAQGSSEVVIAVPYGRDAATHLRHEAAGPGAQADAAEARTAAFWRGRVGGVELRVPPEARAVTDTVRSTLAYILINRDGAALQPGSRTYTRSWIRDGAMTSTALLEMGLPDPVRDFLPWYAGFQFPNGQIPCAIDRYGADPLPEHDSNGEFLYALAEYYRYTHDVGLVYRLWPHAVAALDYLERLRAERLTAEYESGPQRIFRGLLPESISHEGYAQRPVHSYWDDFYALRGLKDAVLLARVVDDPAVARRAAALRDGLQADLHASIAAVMEQRALDYIPASADLGDFDPSSTTIALEPGGEQARLPAGALATTFARYVDEVRARRDRDASWENYAPYELRIVGTLVRLGERAAALEVLDWLMTGRRPAAWNHWGEIVWRDPLAPRFIGDMPHTWVAAGFVEAVRTMFAYEREDDDALVLAAGLPRAWVEAPGGTGVRRLPTQYGVLSYALHGTPDGRTTMTLSGVLAMPAGGLVLQPPLPATPRTITIDGKPLDAALGEIVVQTLPATVVFEP